MSKNCSEQKGIIKEVKDGQISIVVKMSSACEKCHVQSNCMVSDNKTQTIYFTEQEGHKVGDQLTLLIDNSLGMKAVFFAYIVPFLLVFLGLLVFTYIINNEGVAGLLSLLLLLPYYVILYIFRGLLNEKFRLKLKK